MVDDSVSPLSMRTRTLTVALVSALLIAGTGTVGAFAIGPLHPQQSPTGTTTGPGSGMTTTGGGTTAAGPSTASGSGPGITFDDQNSSGQTVLVQSATLPQNGFIAIYDSTRSGNATDKIIGASYLLDAGTTTNIRIQLDQPLNQTKSLTAVYHADSNGNGEFDFVSSNGQQDPAPPEGQDRTVAVADVTVQGSDTGGDTPTESGGATATTTSAGGDATEAAVATQTAAGGTGNGTAGGTNASGGNGGGGSGAFGPGFGLVVAVVALLAVALLAARRN
jgi:PGF-CTERM protein